ncbi:class I SAM-dependent methyltransferase [Halocatena pleomorpha]|uniref:Class I SAM-dependent methyltransferase n=1 Tax=Halocatena pleomorpha TaxID=1785090 RepID=A0A3P3R4Y3_9EURY|nr:class I SAM-dependent methyltransferase [Halocatena pleomorpha]RRJ27939.1 class I SAM-dependent methyltransferase [Halocatena pleomorpha]
MTDTTERLEVDGFALIGRTFEEYVHMFDLDPAALAGQTVLDCPSGVGSFVRTANERGIDAMGVDIAYGMSPTRLSQLANADYEHVVAQLREMSSLFEWGFYGDIDGRSRYLKRAHEEFSDDFERNRGRYVHAALPSLPFNSDSFSVVLSAHCLFLYGDRLDREFYLASLRELARVATEEVRVFPLSELDTNRYHALDWIVKTLESEGYTPEQVSVPFEFQRGVAEMLRITDV